MKALMMVLFLVAQQQKDLATEAIFRLNGTIVQTTVTESGKIVQVVSFAPETREHVQSIVNACAMICEAECIRPWRLNNERTLYLATFQKGSTIYTFGYSTRIDEIYVMKYNE